MGIQDQVRIAVRRPRGDVARAYATTSVNLDQEWRAASYCAVDLETTGLDLRRDMIISFGSVGHRRRAGHRGKLDLPPGRGTDARVP